MDTRWYGLLFLISFGALTYIWTAMVLWGAIMGLMGAVTTGEVVGWLILVCITWVLSFPVAVVLLIVLLIGVDLTFGEHDT